MKKDNLEMFYQIERISLCPNMDYRAVKVRKLDSSEIFYGFIPKSELCRQHDIVKLVPYDSNIEETLGDWELSNRDKLRHMFKKTMSHSAFKNLNYRRVVRKFYS